MKCKLTLDVPFIFFKKGTIKKLRNPFFSNKFKENTAYLFWTYYYTPRSGYSDGKTSEKKTNYNLSVAVVPGCGSNLCRDWFGKIAVYLVADGT